MASVQAGSRVGPYRVESVLPGNRGGFAQVVLATRITGDGEPCAVALKLARTDGAAGMEAEAFARALGNEVETLRLLKHPGIVRIYPIPIVDRRGSYMARADNLPGSPWYFVMEYLAGGTVEELVKQQGALPTPLGVEIAHQVAAALDYIHANGYAHLDVKTNNIALRHPLAPDRPPEAVLIDFGAAQKALRRAEVEAGALMYLPPERVRVLVGKSPPETVVNKPAADVYALGITLYRMLTGDLPFHGQRDHVTTAILNNAPTHPMQLNRDLLTVPELDTLIMQMLEKDPLQRPSIKEVLTRLDQAVAPPRFNGVKATLPPPAAGRGWKNAALALAALVLIEGVGLGYLAAGSARGEVAASTPTTAVEVAPATIDPGPIESSVMPKAAPTRTRTPSPEPTTAPTIRALDTPTLTSSGPEPTIIATYTAVPTKRPRPTAVPTQPATPNPAPQPTPGSQP
jgi:eukaryotic-like serine/threonine-protein kinase